jgi:geranylgeranyl pyrophosphate synthase
MRSAHHLFEMTELERLAPRTRNKTSMNGSTNGTPSQDPLTIHESIAYDWLAQGGKRSRPFITLAVFDALKGGPGTLSPNGAEFSDSVRRAALAIETFHKASLVHDDIEDDDTFRYGRETLHRRHGVSTAINVGDYLIGLGYRLVSRERKELGGDCTADILDRLADAHLKLSEGQGAELLWRDAPDKSLTPLDALKIYALKTAPAFEAALYSGLRLAGPTEKYEKIVSEFSKNLGIAFQIINDLKDWETDSDNKLAIGQDVLAARPTLLLALALEGQSADHRHELLALLGSATQTQKLQPLGTEIIEKVRDLYERADVFAKATQLIDKFRARAETIADDVEPTELRELLYFLVDTVLDRPTPAAPELDSLPLVQLSK